MKEPKQRVKEVNDRSGPTNSSETSAGEGKDSELKKATKAPHAFAHSTLPNTKTQKKKQTAAKKLTDFGRFVLARKARLSLEGKTPFLELITSVFYELNPVKSTATSGAEKKTDQKKKITRRICSHIA